MLQVSVPAPGLCGFRAPRLQLTLEASVVSDAFKCSWVSKKVRLCIHLLTLPLASNE